MKKLYTIRLRGCDAETIFKMELDERELQLVQDICTKSQETSTYVCMPEMFVYDEDNLPKWLKEWDYEKED